MEYLRTLIVFAALLPVTSWGQGPPLDSAEAVARAVLVANPEVEALEAQTSALEALVTRAGVRPDLVAGVEYSNVPLTAPWPGGHAMSGVQLKLSQTLLGGGKVRARVAEAQQRVRSSQTRVATLQNRLAGSAAEGWQRLALVRQLKGITAAHVDLVQQLLDVVKVNYEVGRSSQHELLQLQTLHDKLADDLLDFELRDRVWVARLNAALHREGALHTPDQTALVTAAAGGRSALVAAVDGHPLLRQLHAAAALEARGAERAEHEMAPNFTVSAGYRVRRETQMGDAGEDLLSVGVAMPLPWYWNDARWGSQASAHRARAQSAEAQIRSERDRLVGEIDAALARLSRAQQKAATYEGSLVTLAHRALDSTFAAYRVARAGFSQLFQAEVVLLDLERAAIKARGEAALAQIQLRTLTGAWVPTQEGSR